MGVCVALVAGCNAAVIEGTVCDIKGEALPGVVVSVEGRDVQALTSVLGEYRLRVAPGRLLLTFSKTGYTPGQCELDVESPRRIQAQTMTLWCLPPGNGVFLYEDYRYRPTRAIEREGFLTQEGRLLYGTTKYDPDRPDGAPTHNPQPALLCYYMPREGVQLHRLERTEVVLEDARAGTPVKVWVPIEAHPVSLVSVDEPEGLLQQVRITDPLEPGVYAVHWGAFEGGARHDPRIFVFTVKKSDALPAADGDAEIAAAQPGRPTEPPPRQTPRPAAPSQEPGPPTPRSPEPEPAQAQPKEDYDLLEPVLHDM